MNPLKRLKLKSQLRNCDYVLAGTVIKQQYYDPAKNTVINNLIDEFMANPNFDNALKLIEYNEMLTFYFTESCAGGLYVRKSTQDASTASSRQPSPDDEMSRPSSSVPGAGSGTKDQTLSGVSATSTDLAEPARPHVPSGPAESSDDADFAGPATEPGLSDPLTDPLDDDPKRRLRRQKQQEILQESEALMEQLLSLDIRRRKTSSLKDGVDAGAGRDSRKTGETAAPEPDREDNLDADTRLYRTPLQEGRTPSAESIPDISLPSFMEKSAREAAPAMEPDMVRERPASLPAENVRSGGEAFSKTEPAKPKPSWARKPYWDDMHEVPSRRKAAHAAAPDAGDVPDMDGGHTIPVSDTGAVKRDKEAGYDTTAPEPDTLQRGKDTDVKTSPPAGDLLRDKDADATARDTVQPAKTPEEPPPHRLPKRSYANVIATLKIDIHTMATQLEDCRRKLSQNPPNEKQLIAWISALEDAIEEFSQVVDHLEEHQ